MTTTIETLRAEFEAATTARETAYKAMWAEPKNKALVDEFTRLQFAAHKAKQALAAAQDAPVVDDTSTFSQVKAARHYALSDAPRDD